MVPLLDKLSLPNIEKLFGTIFLSKDIYDTIDIFNLNLNFNMKYGTIMHNNGLKIK